MSGVSKEFVKKGLEKGDYSIYPKSDSCNAEWWSTFDRIRDKEGKTVAFVRCHRCLSLLAYDPKNLAHHHSVLMQRAVVRYNLTVLLLVIFFVSDLIYL